MCQVWAQFSRRPLLGAGGRGGEAGEKGPEGVAVREIHAVVSNSPLFLSLAVSAAYRPRVLNSHASTKQPLLCEICSETYVPVRGEASWRLTN